MQSPFKIRFESWSPLHWAAFRGQNDAIARLIQTRADRNARDSIGATPLHCAVLGRTLNSNDLPARDREIFDFFQPRVDSPLRIRLVKENGAAGASIMRRARRYAGRRISRKTGCSLLAGR